LLLALHCVFLACSVFQSSSKVQVKLGVSPSSQSSTRLHYDTVWDLITRRNDSLSTLGRLVRAAGLVQMLNSSSAVYTALLPSDSAFSRFYAELNTTESAVLNQTDALRTLIMYHIDTTGARELEEGMELRTSPTAAVMVVRSWSGLLGARGGLGHVGVQREGDMRAGFSLANIIDRVLVPIVPSTLDDAFYWDATLSHMYDALKAANYSALLANASANVTVLAADNQAFEQGLATLNMNMKDLLADRNMLQAIVSAHIIPYAASWSDLVAAQDYYVPTLNPCTNLYADQFDNGTVLVHAVGQSAPCSTAILDGNRVGGRVALLHVVSALLLPKKSPGGFGGPGGGGNTRPGGGGSSCWPVK